MGSSGGFIGFVFHLFHSPRHATMGDIEGKPEWIEIHVLPQTVTRHSYDIFCRCLGEFSKILFINKHVLARI